MSLYDRVLEYLHSQKSREECITATEIAERLKCDTAQLNETISLLRHNQLVTVLNQDNEDHLDIQTAGIEYLRMKRLERSAKWADRRWGLTQMIISSATTGAVGFIVGYITRVVFH